MNESIQKIKEGEDSRRNWRTINKTIDRLATLRTAGQQSGQGIAELRKPRKDASGGSVSTYRIVSVESDHYVCHTWDEATLTEGSSEVLIARPWEHRNSILSEEIAGTTYDYTYTTTTERESDDGSTTETQVIVPYIILHEDGDNPTVICAIECNTGVEVEGSPVTLLDINVAGRAWAMVA